MEKNPQDLTDLQPILRLYDIPDESFESDAEDDDEEEEEVKPGKSLMIPYFFNHNSDFIRFCRALIYVTLQPSAVFSSCFLDSLVLVWVLSSDALHNTNSDFVTVLMFHQSE